MAEAAHLPVYEVLDAGQQRGLFLHRIHALALAEALAEQYRVSGEETLAAGITVEQTPLYTEARPLHSSETHRPKRARRRGLRRLVPRRRRRRDG